MHPTHIKIEIDIEIKTHHDISSYIVHETAIFNVPVTKLGVQGKLINAYLPITQVISPTNLVPLMPYRRIQFQVK
jgi:hypothetical protein